MDKRKKMMYPILMMIAGWLIVARVDGGTTVSQCPSWFHVNGRVRDMGFLSDVVSWDIGFEFVNGTCGNYLMIGQADGLYDTRMRIYRNMQDGSATIVFRPTINTVNGLEILEDRALVPCELIEENPCIGHVNDHFQAAFLSLLWNLPTVIFLQVIHYMEDNRKSDVYLTGYDLGGSLQLMMGIYLMENYQIIPRMMIGFGGSFIGDANFTNAYQIPLRDAMGDHWRQIETVDARNTSRSDTNTIQGGGVIQEEVLCNLLIHPMADVPDLHNLKNYRSGLDESLNTNCTLHT